MACVYTCVRVHMCVYVHFFASTLGADCGVPPNMGLWLQSDLGKKKRNTLLLVFMPQLQGQYEFAEAIAHVLKRAISKCGSRLAKSKTSRTQNCEAGVASLLSGLSSGNSRQFPCLKGGAITPHSELGGKVQAIRVIYRLFSEDAPRIRTWSSQVP